MSINSHCNFVLLNAAILVFALISMSFKGVNFEITKSFLLMD